MAEAMWHGKPVIATGYSGNLDFMTPDNSLLVEHQLVPIGSGADPYPAEGEWAEPDPEHAAALMRRVFGNREYAAELGRKAAASIRTTHSSQAAGEIMYRRLESIRGTGRVRRIAGLAHERPPALADLPLKVRRGPVALGPRRGRARGMLRSAILRAVRPFSIYQQTVNWEVVAALEEVHDEIARARRGAASEFAALLAQLRSYGDVRTLPSLVEAQARRIDELERRLVDESEAIERPK